MAPEGAKAARATSSPPRVSTAVLRFLLASFTAVAVVVIGGFFALRGVAEHEAVRETRDRVKAAGSLVEAAALEDGLPRGDRSAQQRMDDVVTGQVLADSIARVKVWSRDGKILYSDEPRLIGRRFKLGEDEQEIFRTGAAAAEVSDLGKAENVFERPEGKLLEAHTVIRTPDGTPVLFEIYRRYSSVTASAERLVRDLAPPLLAGVIVLLLLQIPLAWSMARRLQRQHVEREELLSSAVLASAQERRRIAGDLHDGVVQDLAGVAFGLAPLADDARRRQDADTAQALDGAAAKLRQGVRGLRTLLVDLHPPNLGSTGVEAALSDLLSPLAANGIKTELDVSVREATHPSDPLVYRVAREAVRNAHAHAEARSVTISLVDDGTGRRLVVSDDGRGFSDGERLASERSGHVGLTLLQELVAHSGGQLDVSSEPGRGTRVELEVAT